MAEFQHRVFQDLCRQLMLSPAQVRRRYADRLEEFLLEFDPTRTYPYEFIYFRITGFRPQGDRREAFPGPKVLPDLQRMLEELSGTVPTQVEDEDQRVYSLDQVVEACDVSVRTIHRWRRRGLVSRKYLFPDGRVRTGIPAAALEHFLEQNEETVQWSRRFSKLSDQEEAVILERARALAAEEDVSLTAAAARIAGEIDRAPETVRLVLRRHEQGHPQDAIFGPKSGRLGPGERRRLYSEYRQGTPVEALQRAYGRSRASIYRIINRERAAEALGERPTFFYEDAFEQDGAEDEILGEAFQDALRACSQPQKAEAGGPPAAGRARALADPLAAAEPLAADMERALFRAYNFVKFRLRRAQEELRPERYVPAELIDHITQLQERVRVIREALLRLHRPLVELMARQHAGRRLAAEQLADAGEACLRGLLESFDYRGPGRFTRYARFELLKLFARMGADAESGAPRRQQADGKEDHDDTTDST